MAAAVQASPAAVTASPTADNRCVGGGEPAPAVAIRSQAVPLPSSGIPAVTTMSSGLRRRRQRRGDPKVSRSSASSCTSTPPSSSDEEDGDDVAEFGGRGVVDVDSLPSVAVTRLKDLQQHLVDLDDLDLLDRHLTADDGAPELSPVTNVDAAGMAAELRQKNKDLVLAARLGKALLSKNDELSLMNERLAEEYGDKLEV